MEGSISTPPDTGAATTGPASFSDQSLTWTEDSSASTPSPDGTPAASANADATVPPVADAPNDGLPPAAGEPPKERWSDILANARAKAAEEAIAPLAWAKSIPQQEFQQIQSFAQHFAGGDFMQGLQSLIAEGRKDPAVEAQIRSFAARTLAQRSQTQPQQPAAEPEFVVQQQDGSYVFEPTLFQQWKQWNNQQLLSQFQQEIQPLKQSHEQQQKAAAQQEWVDQWNQWQSQTVSEAATWPGMDNTEIRTQFAKTVEADIMGRDIQDVREIERAIDRAYRKIVVPSLTRQAEAKQLDTLQRKAAASTSVNPGSAAASSPRAVRSFSDLPPEAWK